MKITRLLIIAVIPALAASALAITQTDVVGYWTHEFRPGFNLAAFPVLPDTPTLTTVFGDQLGAAEVTAYDPQIKTYRWARYNPETGLWEGNLYLLARGTAFWVFVPGNATRRVVVSGHPEVYTKFRWSQLRFGWQFYAPTYGKTQELGDLPPVEARDLLIGWDVARGQFNLAETTPELQWRSTELNRIAPDRAYIALLHRQPPRQVGPPLELEELYERYAESVAGGDQPEEGNYRRPPEPLVVGNGSGLAVCTPDGEPCNGDLGVIALRERTLRGESGELETFSEPVGQFRVTPDQHRAGRFNIALAVGEGPGMVTVGDRVALAVRDGRGGETRSTSFEVPARERIVDDVEFTEPLRMPDAPSTPREFVLGQPFPNPFNDRFTLQVHLPEATPVTVIIYDIMGRNAFEAAQPLGAGVHRLTIQAGGIAAGIYLVRVIAGPHAGLVKIAHLK